MESKRDSTYPFKQRLSPLRENWLGDLLAGVVVFLIALPLSVGVMLASSSPHSPKQIASLLGVQLKSWIARSNRIAHRQRSHGHNEGKLVLLSLGDGYRAISNLPWAARNRPQGDQR